MYKEQALDENQGANFSLACRRTTRNGGRGSLPYNLPAGREIRVEILFARSEGSEGQGSG